MQLSKEIPGDQLYDFGPLTHFKGIEGPQMGN